MARHPRTALVDRQELLLGIQGLMVNGHRRDPSIP